MFYGRFLNILILDRFIGLGTPLRNDNFMKRKSYGVRKFEIQPIGFDLDCVFGNEIEKPQALGIDRKLWDFYGFVGAFALFGDQEFNDQQRMFQTNVSF